MNEKEIIRETIFISTNHMFVSIVTKLIFFVGLIYLFRKDLFLRLFYLGFGIYFIVIEVILLFKTEKLLKEQK